MAEEGDLHNVAMLSVRESEGNTYVVRELSERDEVVTWGVDEQYK